MGREEAFQVLERRHRRNRGLVPAPAVTVRRMGRRARGARGSAAPGQESAGCGRPGREHPAFGRDASTRRRGGSARRRTLLTAALATSALLASALPWATTALPQAAAAQQRTDEWIRVGTGSTGGVSGLAPAPTGWVIAHDNKAAGQGRIALLSPAYAVTELTWPGTAPTDLESVGAVPGKPGRYVTCTSAGACYALTVKGTALKVTGHFSLPAGGHQNEAFTMTQAGGATVALWADRGTETSPATLYAAILHLAKGTFGAVTTARVAVPWPTTHVRPVSDAAIVDGRILVTSAADNGDNGPFDSAAYEVGTIGRKGARVTLTLHAPTELERFAGHKVEGIACTDDRTPALLGTDDEKLGGFVTQAAIC